MPVGVPDPEVVWLTVAVKVTDSPYVEGFLLDATETLVLSARYQRFLASAQWAQDSVRL